VAVAPSVEVRRAPAVNLASARVVLTNRPNGTSESLAVNLAGTGLTSTGYDPATGTLTITGSAPLATYQTALRSLTYANTAAGATAGARTITVRVNDGTIDSLPHTATVNVTAVTTPPRVTSVQVNDGSAQRSRVTELTVTFSTVVTFAAVGMQPMRVDRTGPGTPGTVTLTADTTGSTPTQTVARLRFSGPQTESGSLIDGNYRLTVLSNLVTAGGVALDGDGDGQPGGDYTLALYRLYGDGTGDRRVDNADFFLFRSTFGQGTGNPAYLAHYDFDGNGLVDNVDFFQFRTRFGTTLNP
jgi:hypothetical protein